MRYIALVFVTTISWLPGRSQELIKTFSLSDTISYGAVDRPGDFYAVTITGQIQRFNKDGKLLLVYKAEKTPTVFDPRDGARIFLYYREDQLYKYMSPTFNSMGAYKIDSSFAIQPWLICPSGDHKLWVLDKVDNVLKKINVRQDVVEVDVNIDSIGSATSFQSMREYQNFLFLLDPNRGVLVYNSLGKHIRTIAQRGILNFNFLGQELYYVTKGTIHFFDLFSAATRTMDIDAQYMHALLTDERMILFTPDKVDLLSFRP